MTQPSFIYTKDTVQNRWKAIRTFIQNWFDVEIPNNTSFTPQYNCASLNEYMKLNSEIEMGKLQFSTFFRDSFHLKPLEQFNALTLMLQCEGDLYWAVKMEELHNNDANVHTYCFNYDTNQFEYWEKVYSSIATFVMVHLSYFIHANSGCSPRIKNISPIRERYKTIFNNYCKMNEVEIFEDDNCIALIVEQEEDNWFFIHLKNENINEAIKNELSHLTMKNGGFYYGHFFTQQFKTNKTT